MQNWLTEANQRAASEQLDHVAQTGSLEGVTPNDFLLLKQHLLTDPFDFGKFFCDYSDLTDAFHRPLAYIGGHCTDKLVTLLNKPSFNSYVLSALRVELQLRDIDWNTPEGYQAFDELLDFVNLRLYRGAGKSSVLTHASILWCVTRDPNDIIALMSVNDEAARGFCKQIRDTLNTDLYRLFFPERIPNGDLSKLFTESHVTIGGRTTQAKERTIEARGFLSAWARTHFKKFWYDDIVTDANCGDADLKAVRTQLGNQNGLHMPKVRIWRRHVGTVWAEQDDHAELKKIPHCLTLVIPIEVYDGPTPEDMSIRGTPTNPEWHDERRIRRIFAETCANEKEGPLGYKRNFWLDPLAATGDRMFPASLVNASLYPIVKRNSETVLKRLARDEAWQPIFEEDGKTPKYAYLNPFRDMRRVLGIDPAYSQTGDDWAVTALGTDLEECNYQLETLAGKGWEALQAAIIVMILKWQPHAVGYERAGAQEETFKTWLANDKNARRYKRLFQPVSHNSQSKDWRLANLILEFMRMKRLLLNKNDAAMHDEMTGYIPGPKAKDNRLDSLAIAMTLARKGRTGMADWRKALQERQRRAVARRDPITGVKVA
jgi:hypothetical protein